MVDLALPVSTAAPKPALTPAVQALQSPQNKKSLHGAATKFEAMFMNEMLSHMFDGIETDGPFGGGHGEEVFRSLMIDQYSKMIADSGQTKISNSLEKEMLRMQEQQKNPNKPLHL